MNCSMQSSKKPPAPEFKATRVSLGLSQSEIGRIIRKSERTIRRYEKGDLPILEDVAAAAEELARQFNLEP